MNGTFVNNVQIQEHRLKDQDRIAIGMYELKYETTRTADLHIEAGSGTVTDVNSWWARKILGRPCDSPRPRRP